MRNNDNAKRLGKHLCVLFSITFSFLLSQPDTAAQWGSNSTNNINNTNSGNVGIGSGNTIPLSRLSITPLDTEAKITLWDGGSASFHYGFGVSPGQLNYHVYDAGSSHVFFQGGRNGNGTPLMTIKGDGNVGIGTTTPSYRLDVSSGFFHSTFNTQSLPPSSSFGGLALSWNKSAGQAEVNFYNVWENPGIAYLFSAKTGANSAADLLSILGNGNVGIGTTSPSQQLQIHSAGGWTGTRVTTAATGPTLNDGINFGYDDSYGGIIWNREPTPIVLSTSNTERMRIDASGKVGVGTTNPLTLVHVGAGSAPPITAGSTLLVENGVATSAVIKSTSGGEMFVYQDANNGTLGTATTHPLGIRTNNINRIWIEANGNVGIGTMSPQNALDVNGTISGTNVIAKYQDVAEWVPTSRAMPAGTVVTLDPEHSNLVVASSHSYDTRVAGVVSERPGVILGEGGEGKVMVATTGRVRVKVDATNGPIRVGDLLVTSDKEGIAMRSQPLDLGGTPIHRPGTLIGKALEPLEKGVGEILVLLSLQ